MPQNNSKVQFGIMDVKTREVYAMRFGSETEALAWLAKETRISINDCETVKRHVQWSDWQIVHDHR